MNYEIVQIYQKHFYFMYCIENRGETSSGDRVHNGFSNPFSKEYKTYRSENERSSQQAEERLTRLPRTE